MIAIISPAKSMDFEPVSVAGTTVPVFQKQAFRLVEVLREHSQKQLQKTLSISESLAALNHKRFIEFKKSVTEKSGKPALYAYTGDVYKGILVDDYTAKDLTFVSKHVRIISGLYGILKPLDLIQPYRLEMGTKLKNAAGNDLYAFWGKRITEELNGVAKKARADFILNLASNEYAKSITEADLVVPLIAASFKVKKAGGYKVIGLLAKRARGAMVQHIVESRAKTLADLKKFNKDGYEFNSKLSTERELVFTREK